MNLTHKGTIQLNTERLILRKVCLNDVEHAHNSWCSNPNVSKYLPWETHKNIEVTKKIFSEWINQYKYDNFYLWGIVKKDNNELIGTISVVKKDDLNYCSEVGYCISEKYWGYCYTKEALIKVIEFLFNEVNYHRIEAKHFIQNTNSGKVMKKAGMKYEGLIHQKYFIKKNFRDMETYYILKGDINEKN